MAERKDALGDRLKAYERIETDQQFPPNTYLYVRIDGRSFSKFTKGLERPFDPRFSALMQHVTRALVEEFSATIGYTQSDEISLIIENTYEKSCIFQAKKQKLISTIASFATSVFVSCIPQYLPSKNPHLTGKFPSFDCRIFPLGTPSEVANALLWREYDALKNSVSMAASHYFSHKSLMNLNSDVKKDMLKTQKDVIWDEYPAFFKQGTYFKRQTYFLETADEPVTRSRIVGLELLLSKMPHETRIAIALGKYGQAMELRDGNKSQIMYSIGGDIVDFEHKVII